MRFMAHLGLGLLALIGWRLAGAHVPQAAPVAAWPGVTYDAAVPAPEQVLGYSLGERFTTHSGLRRYLQALAAALPERTRLVDYGRSWQDRELSYLVIGSAGNLARLDSIKAAMQSLADPRRTSRAEAEALIATTPAVVWLAYSVHGNELSPTDAAIATAYHLLAAQGDERLASVLDNTIVIINPLQNPDGRERFIQANRNAAGLQIDPDPLAAERNEPWPPGRFNQYLFDLNRDWFAQTQPESRAHARALLAWFPVVLADLHEMNTDATYFFPPGAPPRNPWLTEAQRASSELIGRNNARWMDRFGRAYFTREVYDEFYPGYGDGWAAYHGTVSMTYEQGSARGLAARRSDGTVFSYASTVEAHTITSLATIESAAQNRALLLRNFYQHRSTAIEEGKRSRARTIVIPTQQDQGTADKLALLLARQGIEIGRATDDFSACGREFSAGAYVIDSAQPAARLIRVLLDERVPLAADFTAEQERRRARNLADEIYDLTAWSMPLLFNTELERCAGVARAPVTSVDADAPPPGQVANVAARVAFLVPWGDTAAARLLVAAQRAGLRVDSSDEAFEHQSRRYPAGTLIIPVANNIADLADKLDELARASGARVVGVDDGWVTEGPSFGSAKIVRMPAPRIAIAWDAPTDPTSAGALRYVLERQFGQPVTAIRVAMLGKADLSNFDVLVLPEGKYEERWGEAEAANLASWVRRGGVLIGLGRAMRFLAEPSAELLSVRREDAAAPEKPGKANDETDTTADADRADKSTVPGTIIADAAAAKESIQPERRDPDAVAGVIVRATVDQEHWLGAGVAPQVYALLQGRDIYSPVKLDQGVNVARFAAAGDVLASGYLWQENRAQLAFKPLVVLQPSDRGLIIGFTTDPVVRGFADGLNLLLINAIYRGAAHARPVR
ncbi:MAG TPA: M14 family metallopeptidase [Steroidobacteraceae bacterium]|nr:M14 family metallopeptidase [Steroidobacteraceae bacterium]